MKNATQSVLAWVLPLIAVFVLGPIAAYPVAQLRSAAGGTDTSFLLTATPVAGVLALAWVTIVTAVAAAIAARLGGATVARHTAGFVLVWVVLRTGNTRLMLMELGGGAVVPLAIEGALVLAAGLVVYLAIHAPTDGIKGTASGITDALTRRAGLITLAVATAAALLGAFVVSLSGLPGQGAFGGFMAGIAAGALGKLVGQTLGDRDPEVPAALAPLLAAIIAPLTLIVFTGGGPVADAARGGELSGLGLIQPAAWLLASAVGVPVGSSWAASSSERTERGARPKHA